MGIIIPMERIRKRMEKKEYIEREKLIEHLKKDPLFDFVERYGITGVIESIPAADVRPVVLCRDCKHWETGWTPKGVSDGRHYCAPLDLYPSAGWYCYDGEKREES